jgi:hypothetical protein
MAIPETSPSGEDIPETTPDGTTQEQHTESPADPGWVQ